MLTVESVYMITKSGWSSGMYARRTASVMSDDSVIASFHHKLVILCSDVCACCINRFVRTLTLERSLLTCQWLMPTAATMDGLSARSTTKTSPYSRSTRPNSSWWRPVVSIVRPATSTSCRSRVVISALRLWRRSSRSTFRYVCNQRWKNGSKKPIGFYVET